MNTSPLQWLLLIVSLPTTSATARVRIWRTLKSLGCGALRDGAYLLPHSEATRQTLSELSEETVREGGVAWLMHVRPVSDHETASYRVLFDRTAEHAEWLTTLADIRKTLPDLAAIDITKSLRKLRREYDALRAIDYFPNDTSSQADTAWTAFVQAADSILSPGEPHSINAAISRLDINDYQGRTWATRQRMWVDRVASAWLIRRFIDRKARFLWLASPADCPSDALGFDFDGAAFTHVGERVSFEVLLASFSLDQDVGLLRLGAMVHALDVGSGFVPEASGFEAMMAGARQRALNDDQLLAEISLMLDSLYAHFSNDKPSNKEIA